MTFSAEERSTKNLPIMQRRSGPVPRLGSISHEDFQEAWECEWEFERRSKPRCNVQASHPESRADELKKQKQNFKSLLDLLGESKQL